MTICVKDTGIGMNKETRSHIFEPFFTTKELGKGTGMGLAAVYGTVKNHKGAIVVQSEPGQGTEFKLYLPIPGDVRDKGSVAKVETSKPLKGSAHILLVEDEDHLRNIAEKILTRLGYKTSLCKDGKEAVKFYKKYWQEIDLVILDMVMPVMNGKDAFFEMRKINPDIVVLLISGYSLDGEAQKMIDEGVKDFLKKPFKEEELSRKIAEVLKAKKGMQSIRKRRY